MHSKNTINETKNKKPKKVKLKLVMLLRLQLIYFLDVLGMSSKSSCAKPFPTKFPFRKTSRWKFFDVKLTHFAARIAAPMENNRSTAKKLGKGVLYFINTSAQIYRCIES